MRRFMILATLMMFAAGTARADLCADWSTGDTWRQAAGTALLMADWAQTRAFAGDRAFTRQCRRNGNHRHCEYREQHHEMNPFLGAHPGPAEINIYFASVIGLHLLTSCSLVPDFRSQWQSIVIGVQIANVWNNHQIGVRITGSF